MRGADRGPVTPFGALMKAGVFGKGARNVVVDAPDESDGPVLVLDDAAGGTETTVVSLRGAGPWS